MLRRTAWLLLPWLACIAAQGSDEECLLQVTAGTGVSREAWCSNYRTTPCKVGWMPWDGFSAACAATQVCKKGPDGNATCRCSLGHCQADGNCGSAPPKTTTPLPSGIQLPENVLALAQQAEGSYGKLMFTTGNVTSGTAGGHQFANIWVRDFCHSTVGLFEQPQWEVQGEVVPTTTLVASTLAAILRGVSSNPRVKIPRALDYFWPVSTESLLSAKVLQGAGYLQFLATQPFPTDVGEYLSTKPNGSPLQHFYDGEGGVNETIDSGYMIILAFTRLTSHLTNSEIETFCAEYGQKLKLALEFYSEPHRWILKGSSYLLQQNKYTDWKDSIKQEGVSSWTNLQLIEAIAKLLELCRSNMDVAHAFNGATLFGPRFGASGSFILNLADPTQYASLTSSLKQWKTDIFLEFYNETTGLLTELAPKDQDEDVSRISHIDAQLQWLSATVDDPDLHARISLASISNAFLTLDSSGNILAVSGINAASWPRGEIDPMKSVVGLSQYHGTMAWSWWLGWFAHHAVQQGDLELSTKLLAWLASAQADPKLEKKGFGQWISEVYYTGGEIVSNYAYTSETPFLWGSSYVLQAVNLLNITAHDAGEFQVLLASGDGLLLPVA